MASRSEGAHGQAMPRVTVNDAVDVFKIRTDRLFPEGVLPTRPEWHTRHLPAIQIANRDHRHITPAERTTATLSIIT